MLKKPGSRVSLNCVFVFLFSLGYFGIAAGQEESDASAEYSDGARQCMTCVMNLDLNLTAGTNVTSLTCFQQI